MTRAATAAAVAIAGRPHAGWARLMVGVDDPYASGHMLELAIDLARSHGAKLRLVHVVGGRPARLEARGLAPAMIEDVCRATGRAVLLEAEGIARRRGVAAETVLVQDDGQSVGRILTEEARRWQASVIVLGRRTGPGERVVPQPLGRVAEVVIRTAPVPVLLVPGPAAGPRGDGPAPVRREDEGSESGEAPGRRVRSRRRLGVSPRRPRPPALRPVPPPPPR